MTEHAYLFEAKGIQRWIMEGGRLRDIAAASNLLARCFRSDRADLLSPILVAAGLEVPECPARFSRRAGGAFVLHYTDTEQDQFDQFRALLRLAFMQALPGLEFVEAWGSGDTAEQARARAYRPDCQRRSVAGRENGAASLLPGGHALTTFSPRTGRPAVPDRDHERIDAVTTAKRRQAAAGEAVGLKFVAETDAKYWRWPNQMDDDAEPSGPNAVAFPFAGEDRWIAVMHADISALGRFYAAIGAAAGRASDPIPVAREAADHIERAVIAAARHASAQSLLPAARARIVPARPIVLGGDDVTIILRGDVALPFTRHFLARLEMESQTRLTAFATTHCIEDAAARGPLTAAAGIAFGKAKQPFFRLLDLAEGLCGHAKTRAKATNAARPPSVISFLRITESVLATEADELFERLELPGGALHAQPYCIDEAVQGFVSFDKLDALRRSLLRPELRAGGLRELRSLLLQGQGELAGEHWKRWQHIARKRDVIGYEAFRDKLAPLVGASEDAGLRLFAAASPGAVAGATPLFDALEWNTITGADAR